MPGTAASSAAILARADSCAANAGLFAPEPAGIIVADLAGGLGLAGGALAFLARCWRRPSGSRVWAGSRR
jgi:hypothetical protein